MSYRKTKKGGTVAWKKPTLAQSASGVTQSVNYGTKQHTKEANMHNELIQTAGGCDTTTVPLTAVTYSTGASDQMSPNGNENMKGAQQLAANQQAQAALDDPTGWDTPPTQGGGGTQLGTFIENLNNMGGGRRRKRRSRKRKRRRRRRRRLTKRRRSKAVKRSRRFKATRRMVRRSKPYRSTKRRGRSRRHRR